MPPLLVLLYAVACATMSVNSGAPALRASPKALRALRDLGLVGERVRELQDAVRPAAEQGYASLPAQVGDLSTLQSILNNGAASLEEALSELSATLKSATSDDPLAPAPASPSSLKALCDEASSLHRKVKKQREYILVLEEQEGGAAERTRAIFDELDSDGSGEIEWTEFQAGAAALLPDPSALLKDPSYATELHEQFVRADSDGSSSLSYDEFVVMMSSLSDDSLGQLVRRRRGSKLARGASSALERLAAHSSLLSDDPRAFGSRLCSASPSPKACRACWPSRCR